MTKAIIQTVKHHITLSRLEKKAIKLGLEKMFKGDHFSIINYKTLCEAAGVSPQSESYRALQVLHCVRWSDMDRETKQMVFQAVIDTFENPAFDMDRIDKIPMLNDTSSAVN